MTTVLVAGSADGAGRTEQGGVFEIEVDQETGQLSPARLRVRTPAASYVAVARRGTLVLAVNEVSGFAGAAGGAVSAFRRDPVTGHLTPLGTRSSGGEYPCHLAVAPHGRQVVVANFGDGAVAVLPLAPDGRLGPPVQVVRWASGTSHAHMAAFDPVTGEVIVVDLGADAVFVASLHDGRLGAPRRIGFPAGSGPRHLAFHPGGERAYVVSEFANSVTVLVRSSSGLVRAGSGPVTRTALPAGSASAAIRTTRTGLLVTVRGPDVIAVLDQGRHRPRPIAALPSAGRIPRDLLVTTGDRFALVANQGSHEVVCLALGRDRPRPVSRVAVPSPSCLVPL